MGLLDVLNGMQHGPRGSKDPAASGGGMSPMTMADLALLAYKAVKHATGSTGTATAPTGGNSTAPGSTVAPTGGMATGGLSGGLGGLLLGFLGGLLGGLLVGGAVGCVLCGGLF